MAFSTNSGANSAMCDINVTPLVDVMLVLLIIFMVTAPILSYPIDIDLPQKSLTRPEQARDPPEPIELRIDASGQVYWNASPVPLSALQNMMEAEVERDRCEIGAGFGDSFERRTQPKPRQVTMNRHSSLLLKQACEVERRCICRACDLDKRDVLAEMFCDVRLRSFGPFDVTMLETGAYDPQ